MTRREMLAAAPMVGSAATAAAATAAARAREGRGEADARFYRRAIREACSILDELRSLRAEMRAADRRPSGA